MSVPTDPWDQVKGQPDAVTRLRASVESPVHAYLLMGPPGSGRRRAASVFAGELFASAALAAGDEEAVRRHRELAVEERHPALFVVERVGPAISAEQAREVVRRAATSPPEGERQVIVLVDVHLLTQAAPILLKSIEEPPASTVFVLLGEELPPELATIASRCVTVELTPLPTHVIVEALVADGVEAKQATAAAEGAGGDLNRARLLAADPGYAERRAGWWSVPDLLDGRGHSAASVVDALLGAITEARAPLEQQQKTEVAELREQLKRTGATGAGELDRLDRRHKRERRRQETDEIVSGLGVLASRYREDLDERGGDRRFVAAGQAIAEAVDRMVFNPRVDLLLQALFLRLSRVPR